MRNYCRWRSAWLSGQDSPAIRQLCHFGMARALDQARVRLRPPETVAIPEPGDDGIADIVTAAAAGMIAGVLTVETATGGRT